VGARPADAGRLYSLRSPSYLEIQRSGMGCLGFSGDDPSRKT